MQPDRMVCRACVEDSRSHYMHLAGFSRKQEPTIYSCLQLAVDRSVSHSTEHMIQTFEQVGFDFAAHCAHLSTRTFSAWVVRCGSRVQTFPSVINIFPASCTPAGFEVALARLLVCSLGVEWALVVSYILQLAGLAIQGGTTHWSAPRALHKLH